MLPEFTLRYARLAQRSFLGLDLIPVAVIAALGDG